MVTARVSGGGMGNRFSSSWSDPVGVSHRAASKNRCNTKVADSTRVK